MGGGAGEGGEPKEPPGVGSNVDLLHCYKLRASGAQLPPTKAGEEVKAGWRVAGGICRGSVQSERERELCTVGQIAGLAEFNNGCILLQAFIYSDCPYKGI